MKFEELGLIEPILKALNLEGYTNPTPIQEQAIPFVLNGRDLLGCAQTGTGKTAAFAIPIIQLLFEMRLKDKSRKHISTLILTPTRELAIQIGESFEAYGKFAGVKHTVIFGGVNQNSQTQSIKQGIDVLIATPGRLLDLMQQGFIDLNQIKIFVLDEADRMLDMGFVHDVKRVLAKIPKQRQSLFFSATMPPDIISLANTILSNPVKVEVTPVSSTTEKVTQQLFLVDKENKKALLIHLLKQKNMDRVLVFARTKHGADRIAKDLTKQGFKAAAIHGDKSQNARQTALTDFKNGTLRTLIATDIAARGIDIENLSHVINYEIPNQPETYVHRIGRTGRANATGVAFSFCDIEEKDYLKDIEFLIKQKIEVIENHPFPPTVFKPREKNANDRRTFSKPKQTNGSHAGNPSKPNHKNQKGKGGPSNKRFSGRK